MCNYIDFLKKIFARGDRIESAGPDVIYAKTETNADDLQSPVEALRLLASPPSHYL